MQHMLKNCRISRLSPKIAMAKAASASTGKVIDMQGFEGVMFILTAASCCDRSATTKTVMHIQGGPTTVSAAMFSIDGTSTTGLWTAGNFDYKCMVVDVYKPLSTNRFLRPCLYGASTGHITEMIAIQYGTRKGGSTDVWKSSTRAGSSLWNSSHLVQTLSISGVQTTGSSAVSGATAP